MIEDYLATLLSKQYKKEILHIFELYYQDMVKDMIWEDRILKNLEDHELDKELDKELD